LSPGKNQFVTHADALIKMQYFAIPPHAKTITFEP
jgi:hypothetical protein